MKKTAKALFLVVLAALLAMQTVLVSAASAAGGDSALTLKVHYHREDGDYSQWSAWLWEIGGDGGDFPFQEEDGEMVATKTITPGVTNIGYIIRTPDWGKDIDADQFVDISEVVTGTVHIYIESGVEGCAKEYGEDVVIGTRLKTAVYNGDGTVTVTMTGEIEADLAGAFAVMGREGQIAVSGVTAGSGFTYTVALSQELDPFQKYTITYDGSEYSLTIPSVYSTPEFEEEYTYAGDDLGAVWSKDSTAFRVWAPTAQSVSVKLYESGNSAGRDVIDEIEMARDANGTWTAKKAGDLNGVYYTYIVTIDGVKSEACDPYARTTGLSGARAMVIDLDGTDPEGWDGDKAPHAGKSITDAVIYELHVRDLSADENSGIASTGKFLGLTETGTKTPGGVSTGLDHIKDLGVTHVHLLPVYDFGSVEETLTVGNPFNWGYDPVNYNVPEGSYATDPFNGEVRVREMKQMVKGFHDNGIGVIMDVVYNHVQDAGTFNFNRIVPGYFSRVDDSGVYSNGSGCGNDTASERSMVRKYIVDSVCYWADEYHIDGFRFDLVGLLDTETVNQIVEEVHKSHPDVIFYGEGWTMSTEATKEGLTMATQQNAGQTPGFAYFNDTIRDGLKGSVFDDTDPGYVSGKPGLEEAITRCFLGADSWCPAPAQTVNYASCHDNLTLFDHLQTARPEAGFEELVRMNKLAAAVYMTAQGVPFMQAGEEMLRTKVNEDGTFNSNSYNASDEVNCLKWGDLENQDYADVYEYYKGLIAFRKAHGALRLTTAEEVAAAVKPVEGLDANVLAFDIQGGVNGETAEELFVIFNANEAGTSVAIPEGSWNVYVNGEKAGTSVLETVKGGSVAVEPVSALVLVREPSQGSTGVLPAAAAVLAVCGLAGAAVAVAHGKRAKKE